MNTCVICHNAYDPIWDEQGKELIDSSSGICYKCYEKIKNNEITIEEYDLYAIKAKNNVENESLRNQLKVKEENEKKQF